MLNVYWTFEQIKIDEPDLYESQRPKHIGYIYV